MGSTSYKLSRVQHYQDYLQASLPQGVFVTYRRAYIRNICYALQFGEFLSQIVKSEDQNSIIRNQLIKSFVITGCSIVESIIWILLKGNNLHAKEEWKELQKRVTNSFNESGIEHRFEVRHLERLNEPVDIEMRFIDMCRRAEKKKLLGVSSDVYSKLNHLRNLRNRIHIHSVQHDRDNDFWSFSHEDYSIMCNTLKSILKSDIFSPHTEYDAIFYWLEDENNK